jgi:hypothetical protein
MLSSSSSSSSSKMVSAVADAGADASVGADDADADAADLRNAQQPSYNSNKIIHNIDDDDEDDDDEEDCCDEFHWKEFQIHSTNHQRGNEDDATVMSNKKKKTTTKKKLVGSNNTNNTNVKSNTGNAVDDDSTDGGADDDETFINEVVHSMFDTTSPTMMSTSGGGGDNSNDDDNNSNNNNGYYAIHRYTIISSHHGQTMTLIGQDEGTSKHNYDLLHDHNTTYLVDKAISNNVNSILLPSVATTTSSSTNVNTTATTASTVTTTIGSTENVTSRTTTLSIRYRGESSNSTGLGVWSGAELMARFIVENPSLIGGKNVVELGAGTGLCSLLAHTVLGAHHVTATDGDTDVLTNLRYNIRRNIIHGDNIGNAVVTDTTSSTDEGKDDDDDDDNAMNDLHFVQNDDDDGTERTNDTHRTATSRKKLDCRQLIWGRTTARRFLEEYQCRMNRRFSYQYDGYTSKRKDNYDAANHHYEFHNAPTMDGGNDSIGGYGSCHKKQHQQKQKHHSVDVLIATDCIYMSQSLIPFWETVDTLLVASNHETSVESRNIESNNHNDDDDDNDDYNTDEEDDNDDGCRNQLLLYVNVSSSQVSIERVSKKAYEFGFVGEEVYPNVYLFRRRAGRR